MQSESINELASALVAAQGEFSAVPKDSVNPFFSDALRSPADSGLFGFWLRFRSV